MHARLVLRLDDGTYDELKDGKTVSVSQHTHIASMGEPSDQFGIQLYELTLVSNYHFIHLYVHFTCKNLRRMIPRHQTGPEVAKGCYRSLRNFTETFRIHLEQL